MKKLSTENRKSKTIERTFPAEVSVIRLFCEKDEALMEYTGKTFPTMPPKYEYKCPVCGHKEISTVQYPQIVYKERKES